MVVVVGVFVQPLHRLAMKWMNNHRLYRRTMNGWTWDCEETIPRLGNWTSPAPPIQVFVLLEPLDLHHLTKYQPAPTQAPFFPQQGYNNKDK